MSKLSNLLSLIGVSIGILFFAGCGGGGSTDAGGQVPPGTSADPRAKLGFFAWDGVSHYSEVITRLHGMQAPVIYLNPVENGSQDTFESNVEMLQEHNSSVWMLMSGDGNTTYPSLDYLQSQIDRIDQYNTTHPQAIIGLAIDIEPWTKVYEQNTSDNRPMWKEYLAFLDDLRARLHDKGLRLAAAIPFWSSMISEAFPYGKPINHEVVDRTDLTIVMDYTTFYDRFQSYAEDTLRYADTQNKKVKIALEMIDIDDANVSFYDDPESILPFLKHRFDHASFDGYIIHNLDGFYRSGISVEYP
ncbi:hypothetical protein [Nitratifractor sp.]